MADLSQARRLEVVEAKASPGGLATARVGSGAGPRPRGAPCGGSWRPRPRSTWRLKNAKGPIFGGWVSGLYWVELSRVGLGWVSRH